MDRLTLVIAGEIALSEEPGKSMRKWRELFGISQMELAEALSISPSTISDYESGRRKSPGIGVVRRFVDAIVRIDKERGGKVLSQLRRQLFGSGENKPFDVHEFYSSVSAEEFLNRISGKVVVHEELVPGTKIFGYTLIDSVRAIVQIPVHEYLKIFGSTPQRALIFTGVTTGRSPLIAIKISRFFSDITPSLVILQGIETPDKVAQLIADSENILLATTMLQPKDIVKNLIDFE